MSAKDLDSAILNPAAGTAEGITEVRRQEALLKTGALQNAILNSANFSIIATDEKGIIQLFNIGAERMLGYLAAEVVNKINPSDIHDPQEVIARAKSLSVELGTLITPGFEALVFKASRGIEDIYELTYIRKDGSRFPAVVSVTALRDDQSAIIGYLLIGADNSVRKQVEAELNNAKAAAEKANLAKSDFLSSMSHELRSPLNAILGFAQLMESGSPLPTPTQKANIDQILQAGWYLLELINEILDLALIESGKLSPSLEPMSLPEVLLDCQAMIEPQAQKSGIRMSFPQFDSPYFANADRTRVKRVFRHGAALRTLLYVEDNRANMQLVEQLITRRPDMRLLSAGDGTQGIALARTHQPEVILMDINLPGISGIQALKILREDPVTAHIPVLAISANAMPHNIKNGLEAGFFRYLTKPIKVNEFMDALNVALEFAGKKSDKSKRGIHFTPVTPTYCGPDRRSVFRRA